MTKSKCVSGCKGFEPELCKKAPRCSYVSGEQRQYCRLRGTFKIKKTDCSIHRKTSKNQKGLIIKKFMKDTTVKRRTEFLKAVCDDSGVCIALGTNRQKILDFFDGFTSFDHVKPPIVTIGKPSSNGFVKAIQYEKGGYLSNAVLKSSTKQDADNLGYEYLVGKFLNQQCALFPCFLETYGLFYYKDDAKWQHAMDTKVITTNVLKDSLDLQTDEYDYKRMCKEAKRAAIMIQHLKGVKTLGEYMSDWRPQFTSACIRHLIHILYQVYFPLSVLSKTFTHYDLHEHNILLYEPDSSKYIQYHYHINGETVKFKSSFMVKIIDYGRSFFVDSAISSEKIYKSTCKECIYCGDYDGFSYMDKRNLAENNFICSSKNNPSHDLRLLNIIGRTAKRLKVDFINSKYPEMMSFFEHLFDNTQYGVGLSASMQKEYYLYGTRANPKSGFTKTQTKVNNVVDAERLLRDGMPLFEEYNEEMYERQLKLGDIHVYSDGTPMRFEPVA
jgi:hypothetical protein